MKNFDFKQTTHILFGKDQIKRLAKQIKKHSDSILWVYGQSSLKKNELYDQIKTILLESQISFDELSDIKPNPDIKKVRTGIKRCQKNNRNFILATGGGSVIDTAKAIAAGYYYEGDPWELFKNKKRITKALPLGTVLTIAATGSEMNGNAVISNRETKEKLSQHSSHLVPQFSILDPAYTQSVNREQTAAGIADIISHVLEQYFSVETDTGLIDYLSESIIRACLVYGPQALAEPNNYNARANLMWASSLALNGLLAAGKWGDWATHSIEHALSGMFDITHGAGLAIIIPHWLRYIIKQGHTERMPGLALRVFDIQDPNPQTAAIKLADKFQTVFNKMGLPNRLSELGVPDESLTDIASRAVQFGPIGQVVKLDQAAVLTILKMAYLGGNLTWRLKKT